jgi:hypothetical protein
MSFVEFLTAKHVPVQIDLDIVGNSSIRLMDVSSFVAIERGGVPRVPYLKVERDYSLMKYRLVGFLESLDTYGILNRPSRRTKIIYPGLNRQAAALRSFYAARPEEKPKVVLGLQRVADKEDCRLFLDDAQILNWRRTMDERFKTSPLFESDEVWRVFCHELATNIWEHSGSTGFLAARVVDSALDSQNRLRSWCRWTYPPPVHSLLRKIKGGFLELCVADAGQGFLETLRSSMAKKIGTDEGKLPTMDVLAFAFDELGTCKAEKDSWATSRHGLSRILNLVAKYGGALTLRSGEGEIMYIAEANKFQRRRSNNGYEPQSFRSVATPFLGSQLQIILPLIPLFERPKVGTKKSLLEEGLPDSFRTQPEHFRGHLVPLLELLDTPESCIGKEELRRFRSRCERLSRDLFSRRPRNEPLVLDFSGLNWTPLLNLRRFSILCKTCFNTDPYSW